MIFKPDMIRAIRTGRKTQTRRPVKYREDGTMISPYRAGKTYAVQPGGGKHGVARIRVLDVRRERWRDITEEDARAEGFESDPLSQYAPLEAQLTARQKFRFYVCDLYPGLDLDAECWVLGFDLLWITDKHLAKGGPADG